VPAAPLATQQQQSVPTTEQNQSLMSHRRRATPIAFGTVFITETIIDVNGSGTLACMVEINTSKNIPVQTKYPRLEVIKSVHH